MLRLRNLLTVLVALTSGVCLTTESRAGIIYSVHDAAPDFNYPGYGLQVHGTITTDGTLGPLTAANLISWNLDLLGNGGYLGTLMPSNSQLRHASLLATSNGLYFDHESSGWLSFAWFSNGGMWCLSGTANSCVGDLTRVSVIGRYYTYGGGLIFGISEERHGTVQYGVPVDTTPAVPEMSTWAMMMLGFAAMGVFAPMLRRSATTMHVSTLRTALQKPAEQ